jgi:hypothetical protein
MPESVQGFANEIPKTENTHHSETAYKAVEVPAQTEVPNPVAEEKNVQLVEENLGERETLEQLHSELQTKTEVKKVPTEGDFAERLEAVEKQRQFLASAPKAVDKGPVVNKELPPAFVLGLEEARMKNLARRAAQLQANQRLEKSKSV